MAALTRDEIERFFCSICGIRVDLCECEKFKDRGCYDCGPSCEVDRRRKDKKVLADYLAAGILFPSVRPSEILEETDQRSPCCGAKFERLVRNKHVSNILNIEYVAHVCSGCGLMYYLP